MPVFFYRRALTPRDGSVSFVVYAVIPTEGKPDPVPVMAGFPAGWRPTDFPGQCVAVLGADAAYFLTSVPRSQFRHYTRQTEAEALALYPQLLD